jgi:hypothetical protein
MESSSALVVGKAPFPRQRNVPNNKSTTVGVEICFIWSDPEIGIDCCKIGVNACAFQRAVVFERPKITQWMCLEYSRQSDAQLFGDLRKKRTGGTGWLDCYYGAAQSLRTALGLTSASDGQLRLFEEPTAGPIPPGSQDIRAGDLSNAFSCPRVGDDKDWLNCFYAAAQPMRAHLGLAAAPAYTPRSAIDAGAIGGTAIVSQEVHGIRLRTYSFDHAGIVTIALENGQVWKQIESVSNFAHWHGKPDTYVARITKGFWAASI